MKRLTILLLLLSSALAFGQNKELTADESIPIPKVEFDVKGDLKITASPNSSPNDFDFLVGKWKMHNRHLDKRLADCHDWTEFDSSHVNAKILNGAADMDTYSTTRFPGLEGKLFQGLTMRLFDPKTRLWSLYWIASNTGKIDPPVVGSFNKNGQDSNIGIRAERYIFCPANFVGSTYRVIERKIYPTFSARMSTDNFKSSAPTFPRWNSTATQVSCVRSPADAAFTPSNSVATKKCRGRSSSA
jgi:hypothetical protein